MGGEGVEVELRDYKSLQKGDKPWGIFLTACALVPVPFLDAILIEKTGILILRLLFGFSSHENIYQHFILLELFLLVPSESLLADSSSVFSRIRCCSSVFTPRRIDQLRCVVSRDAIIVLLQIR